MNEDNFYELQLQLVAFKIGEANYALDIHNVQEIVRIQPLTRVPNTHVHVDGVINLRGTVVPIINLHKLFGNKTQKTTDNSRIVIVKVEDIRFGIMVDSASEVLRLPTTAVEATPEVNAQTQRDYVTGVAKSGGDFWIMLDPKSLTQFFRQKIGARGSNDAR